MANIVVTTTTKELADSVFSTNLDGVELSLLLRKSWDPQSAERIFFIGVGLASSVATNLFSSWLWDKVKEHRARKVQIDGQECPQSEDEITALIETILREAKHNDIEDPYD